MTNDRLTELEIKAAYQDDLLHTLNNIVAQQQQQISRLEATCGVLNERIKGLSAESGNGSADVNEVPPHY
jgi:SlyX protein